MAFNDPDAAEIERSTDAALVRGRGVHLGAPSARLEMRVALEELLSRTKRFQLVDDALQRAVYPGNGPAALHLQLG